MPGTYVISIVVLARYVSQILDPRPPLPAQELSILDFTRGALYIITESFVLHHHRTFASSASCVAGLTAWNSPADMIGGIQLLTLQAKLEIQQPLHSIGALGL